MRQLNALLKHHMQRTAKYLRYY